MNTDTSTLDTVTTDTATTQTIEVQPKNNPIDFPFTMSSGAYALALLSFLYTYLQVKKLKKTIKSIGGK